MIFCLFCLFSPRPLINLQGKDSTGVVHAPQDGTKILGHQDAYLHVVSFMLGEAFVTEAMDIAIGVASVEATPVV